MHVLTYELFEKLKELLDGKASPDDVGFYRSFEWVSLDAVYRMEFYKNVSSVYAGNVQIRFTHFEITGTWPNHFKKNLMLYSESGDTVAIIPLEKYEAAQ